MQNFALCSNIILESYFSMKWNEADKRKNNWRVLQNCQFLGLLGNAKRFIEKRTYLFSHGSFTIYC